MATRTIPTVFPPIRERDYFTRKIDRAKLFRDLAQAQNYLWAKAYRVYATMAYEGNGNTQTINVTDPAEVVAPDGNTGAICIASFAAPPNWGPSARLKVQGRSTLTNVTTHTRGHIYVQVCETTRDDAAIGTYWVVDYNANGTNDWNVEVQTPQDRTVQVRVFMRSDFDVGEAGTATHQVKFISARYQLPNAAEMSGDAATIGWTALAHAAAANLPHSAGFIVPLVRDTRSLYAMRPPELCQSYLAEDYNNTSTFTEVGRYVVYVPPLITTVTGKLVVWCTNGGAGNEVRVLLGGVVQQTFVALAAGETELTVTAFNITANAENTITIEAKSTAASADWGTRVVGVHFWEEGINLALPGGTTVPTAYAPLDEDQLVADKPIEADLSGSVRAGLKKLMENNTWLARHRLRWLIGDWRHRTLKRIADDQAVPGNAAGSAGSYWDWTRGPETTTHNAYHPRNCTVIPDGTTNDASGAPASDSKDGWAQFNTGYSTIAPPATSANWPTTQKYVRHGQRIGRWRTDSGTSTTPISSETGARMRWLARARRLQPATMGGFDNGKDGPSVEAPAYLNRGHLAARSGGLDTMQLDVIGGTTPGTEDTTPRWYGPGTQTQSNLGTPFNVAGRCRPNVTPKAINGEGSYFEIELQSSLMTDEPLGQGDIDALA